MITLEEYKEILANHFIHNQDNNLIKLNERKKYLSEHYSDEYLNKIISDTYQFIEDVLNNEMIEKDYFSMSLSNNPIGDIFLNLVGGWNSDTLYFDSCGRIISNRILKSVFGLQTTIFLKEEIVEVFDEDIITEYPIYQLYMQHFPKDLDRIREEIFGNVKKL